MERIYGIFSYRLRAGQTSIQPRFNVFPARRRISGSCIFREKSRVRIKLVIARPDEYNGSDILSFLSILNVPTFANLCFSSMCSYLSFRSASFFVYRLNFEWSCSSLITKDRDYKNVSLASSGRVKCSVNNKFKFYWIIRYTEEGRLKYKQMLSRSNSVRGFYQDSSFLFAHNKYL